MELSNATLREIGESLFGGSWQRELARALGVNERTVRSWASGRSGASATSWKRIEALCRSKSENLAAVATRIAAARG